MVGKTGPSEYEHIYAGKSKNIPTREILKQLTKGKPKRVQKND
jgi:hypothetical protein